MNSTQSILELNRERYLQEAEQQLLQMSDAYFYKSNFLLGEGVNRDRMNFALNAQRYLCTDECEMMQFITDKIAGKLERENFRVPNYGFEDVVKQSFDAFGQSTQEAVDECCGWQSVEW